MFSSENFGESELATRYGVMKYPAVFVNEALLARRKDFSWKKEGKYSWKIPGSYDLYRRDLKQMIDLTLRGEDVLGQPESVEEDSEIDEMPKFVIHNLKGESIRSGDLSGKIAVVELWATWCPPCRRSMKWLGNLAREYGDDVGVLALAVDSEEKDVREFAASLDNSVPIAIGTEEVLAAFGDFVVVPTIFVFDREGKTVSVFYGAPDGVHKRASQLIASLR